MNETFERFIVNNAVKSKLAETPVVEFYEDQCVIFIHGYPMTLRGFYTLTTKAVLGATFRMSMKTWQSLHEDTRLLCSPLKLDLHEDREAYGVVVGIKKALNWTKDTFDRKRVYNWINQVEEAVKQAKEKE